MRISRIAAATALAFGALAAPAVAQTGAGHGLGLEYRDTTCAPCRDFFQYANGAWIEHAVIPPAYSAYGANEELEDRTQNALHVLLEDLAAHVATEKPGTDAWRLGVFYRSAMDSARAEAEGAKPLAPELARISAMKSTADLAPVLAHLHSTAIPGLFGFFARQDPGNSTQFIANAGQGGLGLPDRDYYLRPDSASVAMREAYQSHVARTFALLGDDEAAASAAAERVMAIETALARISMDIVQRRDPRATYHKMELAKLESLCPRFGWSAYVSGRGLHEVKGLNVSQPDFFRGVDSLLAAVPIGDWRTYLRWKVASDAAPSLSSAWVDEDFRFRQRLTGAKELLPRWKRAQAETDRELGMALGREYVKRFFPPPARARALAMVKNLEATLETRLEHLSWMSDSTRLQAIAKLRAFHNKVGYPDKWRDYSAMKLGPVSFYENVNAAAAFEVARNMAKIGKPLDRTDWNMTPPTVNAYYSASMNEIVFPAGILQPPFFFFDPNADDAVNYGATGATIGHEMTHGFDDQGRKFDAAGNLHDWWTPEDAKRYQERAQKVVEQFDGYVAVDTLHLNGKLTLGENIADLGGLKIAYDAFEKAIAGKPRKLIDGLTPEQRFFIAYAQSWRWIWRPERTRRSTLSDPHSPPKWRTNGPLENMPEFARAFGCKAGDAMVRPPAERAEIW